MQNYNAMANCHEIPQELTHRHDGSYQFMRCAVPSVLSKQESKQMPGQRTIIQRELAIPTVSAFGLYILGTPARGGGPA